MSSVIGQEPRSARHRDTENTETQRSLCFLFLCVSVSLCLCASVLAAVMILTDDR